MIPSPIRPSMSRDDAQEMALVRDGERDFLEPTTLTDYEIGRQFWRFYHLCKECYVPAARDSEQAHHEGLEWGARAIKDALNYDLAARHNMAVEAASIQNGGES